ncbi:Phospholipase D1 [Sorochytrium milnesiophthora]
MQPATLDKGSFAEDRAENARVNIPTVTTNNAGGGVSSSEPVEAILATPLDVAVPIEALAPATSQATQLAADIADHGGVSAHHADAHHPADDSYADASSRYPLLSSSVDHTASLPGQASDDSHHHHHHHHHHLFHNDQPGASNSLARSDPGGRATASLADTKTSTAGQWKLLKYIRDARAHRRTHREPPMVSLVPILASAIQVPFAAMAPVDKHKQMIPIVLELVKVSVLSQSQLTPELELDPAQALSDNAQFIILCEYGPSKWIVKKTIYDFLGLHSRLSLKRLRGGQHAHHKHKAHLPKFPSQVTYAVHRFRENRSRSANKAAVANRYLALQTYLRKLLSALNMQPGTDDICAFLCISSLSFHPLFVHKPAETYAKVRSVHTKVLWSCLPVNWSTWTNRWVLMGPSFIAMLSTPWDRTVDEIIIMDNTFEVSDRARTGSFKKQRKHLDRHRHSLVVAAGFKRFEFDTTSEKECAFWKDRLMRTINNCMWAKDHRFASFAPVRRMVKATEGKEYEQLLKAQGSVPRTGHGSMGVSAKWFVDGHHYFEAVAEAINNAKDHIYISDWWLSPELYLKRPPSENEEWRLDRLLLKKAKEGVYIYILLYKEMAVALTINSYHSKFALVDLHPNIKVQRHPDVLTSVNLTTAPFWAHHEKLVVVDDLISFVGGLDLCFGRYDTFEHTLTDIGTPTIFPGQDYSNPRVADFRNVDKEFSKTLIERNELPRMGWHDVALMLTNCPDVAWHFVQRWNFVKYSKAKQREDIRFLLPPLDIGNVVTEGAPEITPDAGEATPLQFQLTRSVAYWSCGLETESSIAQAYEGLIAKADYFIYIENQFFVTACDLGGAAHNRIGHAFLERIVRAHQKKERFRIIVIMPLLPAFEAPVDASNAATVRMVMNFQYESISRGEFSLFGKLRSMDIEPDEYITFFSLRSYGCIAPGGNATTLNPQKPPTDAVAQEAALPLTEDMEGSVQLESEMGDEQRSMADTRRASVNSLSLAIPRNTQPAGASTTDLYDSPTSPTQPRRRRRSSTLTRLANILKPNASSSDSQNGDAATVGPTSPALPADPNGPPSGKRFVSEQCYIHAKLMIVDDRAMICGSANLNDRSMLGYRDSELAFVIEGGPAKQIQMDGQQITVSRFVHELRMRLMLEHLGALEEDHDSGLYSEVSERDYNKRKIREEDLHDVLSDKFYKEIWLRSAHTNTEVFRELFKCVPDDTVHTWDQYHEFYKSDIPYGHLASSLPIEQVEEKLRLIQGRLVTFPTDFLKDENLGASLFDKENLIPSEVFA